MRLQRGDRDHAVLALVGPVARMRAADHAVGRGHSPVQRLGQPLRGFKQTDIEQRARAAAQPVHLRLEHGFAGQQGAGHVGQQ
ncbi:hypothetical protein D3C71_1556200 [compost metagenome]